MATCNTTDVRGGMLFTCILPTEDHPTTPEGELRHWFAATIPVVDIDVDVTDLVVSPVIQALSFAAILGIIVLGAVIGAEWIA